MIIHVAQKSFWKYFQISKSQKIQKFFKIEKFPKLNPRQKVVHALCEILPHDATVALKRFRTWFFYRKAGKWLKSKNWGSGRNFCHCAPPSNNAEYSVRSKKSTFFRKSRVFLAPGGSRFQKFLSGNFSVHVAKKQQKLPISATNVVFGFRSIFKGLLNEFVDENRGFEGRTPLCLSDTGNKTQKCSETRF